MRDASSMPGGWPTSPPTRRCRTASSACRWSRTNEGPAEAAAVKAGRLDLVPIFLLGGIALGALALIGSASTWVTLTVAGLAMGLLIFIMASGLTLVFGLMDVMNFAH